MNWLMDLNGIGAVISGVAAMFAAWFSRKTHQELKPNHGSSLRDAVDRLTGKVEKLDEKQNELAGEFQTTLDSIMHAHSLIDRRLDNLERPQSF